ncbi:MAG: hypothetical protein A2Y62_07260 [Candidatus Fischerbacteria bacterium RBG_13_37_8]|uniref:NADH dehydrogenase n=1 Tax=Candidatus Fischerbacteria bacterium RBG_13_37_8 TaxID=1817863 RepID=A0A1F5VJB0_9BACT|nr:MAG: hypothetical protein A2Y62_07260 [Candidatus Fischerbacteria bacterium RBG_13_37_8]
MEKVKVKINGKTVQVESGKNLIQAARLVGVEIPHFCYHEGLTVAGNCRMCLVEVEGEPKLMPACATYVREGLTVLTDTMKVKEARRAVLEFLLVNHPLDCPVCDQSGECKLQDYYMEHGKYESRFREKKIKRQKAKRIGPHIVLDQERCVLCTICIRFCREIVGKRQLGLFSRGDYACIDIFDIQPYDNIYSGNVADICPVGALTDGDFRFLCRAWFLQSTESICPGCSRGCNIYLHHQENKRYLGNGRRLFRVKPRYNPDVNKWWICDLGRYGCTFIDQKRIHEPQKRQNGSFIPVSWNEAYFEIAQLLASLTKRDSSSIGVILSPHLTNEDLFVSKEFFTNLGITDIHFSAVSPDLYHDDFLIKEDKFPNRKGAELIITNSGVASTDELLEKAKNGAYSCLFIIGQDIVKAYGEEHILQCLKKVETVIGQFSNENQTTPLVNYLLPAATFAEKCGSFINFEGRIQKIKQAFSPLHQSKIDWQILVELAKEMGKIMPYNNEQDILKKLSKEYKHFESLDYQKIGMHGLKLNGNE